MNKKPRKEKEAKTAIGFRMPLSLANRLERLGVRGTVGCEIIAQFTAVKEYQSGFPSNTIIGQNGSVLYATDIGDDTHHLTIKKGNQIMIAELTSQDIADCVVSLVDLLNKKNNKA